MFGVLGFVFLFCSGFSVCCILLSALSSLLLCVLLCPPVLASFLPSQLSTCAASRTSSSLSSCLFCVACCYLSTDLLLCAPSSVMLCGRLGCPHKLITPVSRGILRTRPCFEEYELLKVGLRLLSWTVAFPFILNCILPPPAPHTSA